MKTADLEVPILVRRKLVLFPGVSWVGTAARREEVAMICEAIRGNPWLGVSPHPSLPTLCLARIRKVHAMPDGGLILYLLGIGRAKWSGEGWCQPNQRVPVSIIPSDPAPMVPPQGWLRQAFVVLQNLRGLPGRRDPFPPGLWLDLLCHLLPLPIWTKIHLLAASSQQERLDILAEARAESLARRQAPDPHKTPLGGLFPEPAYRN